MEAIPLTIEPKPSKRPGPQKTRQFSASLLSLVLADSYWPSGASGGTLRPAWLVLGGTERALRTVIANLQTGHQAVLSPADHLSGILRLELLKSAGYRYAPLRCLDSPYGPLLTVTAYLPDLFTLDPGALDPDGVRFLALTPRTARERWATQLGQEGGAAVRAHMHAYLQVRPRAECPWPADLAEQWPTLAAHAIHAMSYVERRTSRPLINDPAFYLQLFLAGLVAGLWHIAHPTPPGTRPQDTPQDEWSWAWQPAGTPVSAWNSAALGLCPPVACQTTHEQLDNLLAQEVSRYFTARARLANAPAPAH